MLSRGLVLRVAVAGFAIHAGARAQRIALVSEFERFDPFGKAVAADRSLVPREILSPAVPRNGHLSVRVLVTGPARSDYFLYFASNPPNILQLTMYREAFVRCGGNYYPDWLTEVSSPSFGAIPELAADLPDQITRSYLLDIKAPRDTPPRRIRVEVLLKTGIWQVAPMEVRITAPTVPSLPVPAREDIAPLDASSADSAARQLGRYLAGLEPEFPPAIVRSRDVTQRNAAEDMLLARSLRPDFPRAQRPPGPAGGHDAPRPVRFLLPELNLFAWLPLISPETGAEWYLRVRDFLYSFQ